MERDELIKRIRSIEECDGGKWNVTPEEIADYILLEKDIQTDDNIKTEIQCYRNNRNI